MGYDLTLSGLLRKRGDLSAKLDGLRAQVGLTISQLDHLDATIRIFRPDIELEDMPERLAPSPFAGFRGEIQRFLLDELRKANRPLSTFDLADGVMLKRGLDVSDRVHRNLIRKRTGYALAKLRKAGTITSNRPHRSSPLQWAVVRQ